MTPPRSADDAGSTSGDAGGDAGTEAGDAGGDAGTEADAPDAAGSTGGRGGTREVEVPAPLYKVVTVFSTLLSVVLVVAGFTVLDMATTVVSNPTGSVVVQVLSLAVPMASLVAGRSALALAVGLAGLALVAGGAGVYVYGSRFRAPGMGKPKDEADERSDDG